jgi:hypothetical protein
VATNEIEGEWLPGHAGVMSAIFGVLMALMVRSEVVRDLEAL